MRNLQKVLFAALVAFVSSNSFAVSKQEISGGGSDGCGLGWQVTDKRSLIGTTTRGTTNMTIPPSFGMTSGTMGCEQHSFAMKEMDSAKFVASNFETLKIEISQGQGEFLDAFVATMGCESNASAVRSGLQSEFSTISPSQNGIELYKAVRSVVRSNAALASGCVNAA